MTTPAWRLKLDIPYDFAITPGFRRTMYCHNMVGTNALSANTTFKCPATGLIMLRPSFLTEKWYTALNWKALADWTHNPALWQEMVRAPDPSAVFARHFTTVYTGNTSIDDGAIPIAIAIMQIASAFPSDQIKWVLQGKFDLAQDEGFVFECQAIGDEKHRPRNWFVLSWGGLYIHFSYDGTVRVYTDNGSGGWDHFETFEIASPGDIINRENYFTFLPIPGYGLAIYHAHTAQNLSSKVSSASAGVSRAHLVKLPPRYGDDGFPFVHSGGKVSVGLGAVSFPIAHSAGIHLISYDTSAAGTILDGVFDPGCNLSTLPAQKRAIIAQYSGNRGTGAMVALRNEKDDANWAPGNDRKGRLKISLTTTNSKYTPFLVGTEVGWLPEFATRNTTAAQPDVLAMLEFTENDNGMFSGSCRTHMRGEAQRRITERGDTTFIIERCDNPGATTPIWKTQGGGIARISRPVDVVFDHGGMYYVADWDLTGIERLYSENHLFRANAFDGLDLATAINTVLAISGLPPIDMADYPAAFTGFKLPAMPKGQDWRWGTKIGDQGDEIIRCFLLMARTQNIAYRLRWDWDEQTFVCEAKPHDTAPNATWTLTPWNDDLDDERHALFSALNFVPQPPEANVLQAFGMTEVSNAASLVPGPLLYNKASLSDKTSVDYLGRFIGAYPMLAPFGTDNEKQALTFMTRRIYDAGCHRRLMPIATANDYIDGLKPGKRVLIAGPLANGDPGTLFDGQDFWVRHRTVRLDYNRGAGEIAPTVQYGLDSLWEEMV